MSTNSVDSINIDGMELRVGSVVYSRLSGLFTGPGLIIRIHNGYEINLEIRLLDGSGSIISTNPVDVSTSHPVTQNPTLRVRETPPFFPADQVVLGTASTSAVNVARSELSENYQTFNRIGLRIDPAATTQRTPGFQQEFANWLRQNERSPGISHISVRGDSTIQRIQSTITISGDATTSTVAGTISSFQSEDMIYKLPLNFKKTFINPEEVLIEEAFLKDKSWMDKVASDILDKMNADISFYSVLTSIHSFKFQFLGTDLRIEVLTPSREPEYRNVDTINTVIYGGSKPFYLIKRLTFDQFELLKRNLASIKATNADLQKVVIAQIEGVVNPILEKYFKEYKEATRKTKINNLSTENISADKISKMMEELAWLSGQLEKDKMIPSSKVKYVISNVEKILSGV